MKFEDILGKGATSHFQAISHLPLMLKFPSFVLIKLNIKDKRTIIEIMHANTLDINRPT